MEITVSTWCRGKLIETIDRHTLALGDALTLDSVIGGGKITIRIDAPPKEFESIDIRVNVTEEGMISRSKIPPAPSRIKKLGFRGDQE